MKNNHSFAKQALNCQLPILLTYVSSQRREDAVKVCPLPVRTRYPM